jgi:hypothetical protein
MNRFPSPQPRTLAVHPDAWLCTVLANAAAVGDTPGPPATIRLADGTIGYHVRRSDDCFAAAIATVLQVPIEELPDPRLDERLAAGEQAEEISQSMFDELHHWLASRGLEMVVHRRPPANRRRWIGIVPMHGVFNDHCLVMDRERCLFDPTHSGVRVFVASDVAFGVSFQRGREVRT